MRASLWTAWVVCLVAVWTAAGSAPERAETFADTDAFWAAAASPRTLYSPLTEGRDDAAPTEWCEGRGDPRCAPAAPNAPHQPISFAHGPVGVLHTLDFPRFDAGHEHRPPLERTRDGREGVRQRVERPPRV